MNEVSFFVPGVPVPQGSKNAGVRNGRAFMYEANKGHKAWRAHVQEVAETRAGAFNKDTPVHLEAVFVFQRPKSVKPANRPHMSVKPDLSKLIRSVEDSITKAGVWGDDARVVHVGAVKRYSDETGLAPGAHITIREVTE